MIDPYKDKSLYGKSPAMNEKPMVVYYKLDLSLRSCLGEDPSLDVVLQHVWLAALSTTVSQFLMAVALSGAPCVAVAGSHQPRTSHR